MFVFPFVYPDFCHLLNFNNFSKWILYIFMWFIILTSWTKDVEICLCCSWVSKQALFLKECENWLKKGPFSPTCFTIKYVFYICEKIGEKICRFKQQCWVKRTKPELIHVHVLIFRCALTNCVIDHQPSYVLSERPNIRSQWLFLLLLHLCIFRLVVSANSPH